VRALELAICISFEFLAQCGWKITRPKQQQRASFRGGNFHFVGGMTVVTLQAVHNAKEALRSEISERPDIKLTGISATVGKNAATGIADSGLVRKAVRITIDPGPTIVVRKERTTQVSVNGELFDTQFAVQHGDVIALHSTDASYEYMVHVDHFPPPTVRTVSETSATDQSAVAAVDVDAQPEVVDIPDSMPAAPQRIDRVVEELACTFCLDLQVLSTMLIPCGHSFCRECVSKITGCSTCRAPITGTLPCRQVDNILSNMTEDTPHVFPADDLATYRERLAVAKSVANQAAKPVSIQSLRGRKRKSTYDPYY
jgi:Zinc finger, C3HC4 type (RING finger)